MRKYCLQLLWLLLSGVCFSQTKTYCVIGSSTAEGQKASVPDSMWVNRLTRYYQSVGLTIIPHNLAVGGRNCYQGMPNGYIPPPGRDYPQIADNISMALSFAPDVVIVSYPSNNYHTYSVAEVMARLQNIKDLVTAQGRVCYITTSQPRQDGFFPDLISRTILKVIRDSIMNRFTNYAIDFFTDVANADYTIKAEYSHGDGVHLNDAGHRVLFEKVKAKNVFNLLVPIKLADFSVDAVAKSVHISWKVMGESNGTDYGLQRSKDGSGFETVFNIKSSESKAMNTYKFVDNIGTPGTYFYRLMITDNASRISSSTRKVIIHGQLSFDKIAVNKATLRITLGSDIRQHVEVRLIGSVGAIIYKSGKTLNTGANYIQVPINSLPPGVYWVEVIGNTNRIIHEFLKK